MAAALSILHVLRAPAGGLFRHVRDLARAQAGAGHRVGVLCDARTGDAAADALCQALLGHCALGVHRVAMPRLPGSGDLTALIRVAAVVGTLKPVIVHGHGAKGGLYARLAAGRAGTRAFYTPHGGVLHYGWTSPVGASFLLVERALLSRTAGLVFVCDYERKTFAGKIGLAGRPARVVHNGLWPEDFGAIAPARDGADVVFIGELRRLKGVDVLLEAIAAATRRLGRPVTARIVGEGPERGRLESASRTLGLAAAVTFLGAMPALAALRQGRVMVIPSRAESFPYVMLEAMAAGMPLIASDVGGIAEAVEPQALVAPGDSAALAEALVNILVDPVSAQRAATARMERARERFSAIRMGAEITDFYTASGP